MAVLDHVDHWTYHLGDVSAGRAAEIGALDTDMVITEFASYAALEAPYTPARLDAMRGDDPDRPIVSYISIGEAEDYRWYWDDAWDSNPPDWMSAENPQWEGNLKVAYWDAEWQAIILDYVDQIIAGGFNGLYLDIIDGFEYWEEVAPNAGIDYRQEMADFVALIREHALAELAQIDPNREFVIIGQNGIELVLNDTYAAAVDGIGVEDLRFTYDFGDSAGFAPQGNADYNYVLGLISYAEQQGNEAAVVEYVPPRFMEDATPALTSEAATLNAMGVPLYVAQDRLLDDLPLQPDLPLNRINGSLRRDDLDGTSGRDVIRGRSGGDRIDGGAGADRIAGQNGADVLRGQGGNDRIFGGRHDDRIVGGAGRDVMTGGAGEDTFFFGRNGGIDRITDFDPTEDHLRLRGEVTIGPDRENGVWVHYADNDRVFLHGVSGADLVADVFL